MFDGQAFYDLLSTVCKDNGTSVSAFLLDIGRQKSLGSSIKASKTPNLEVASAAASAFGVSAAWLLGISDDPLPKKCLSERESNLIDCLRSADSQTAESVYRMAFAVLGVSELPADQPQSTAFLSRKSEVVHHCTRKRVEGDAAAGLPITAVPGEDTVAIPEKYIDPRFFVVRARGKSMQPLIPDGACCVFNRDAPADDGRVVLVQIDGLTDQPDDAIKRIYRRGDQVELRSVNPAFKPMLYAASDVHVSGVLVEVLPLY